MRKPLVSSALSGILIAGMSGAAFAQTDNTTQQQPTASTQPAQPGGEARHAMDPEKQLKHMSHRLKLSADQQNQLRPILTERQQQMQAIWQDQSLSKQDRHAKVKSVRDDSNAKIEAVLNDTQKQQFEQMQQHMRERRGEHNGNATQAAPASPQQ